MSAARDPGTGRFTPKPERDPDGTVLDELPADDNTNPRYAAAAGVPYTEPDDVDVDVMRDKLIETDIGIPGWRLAVDASNSIVLINHDGHRRTVTDVMRLTRALLYVKHTRDLLEHPVRPQPVWNGHA